MEFIEIILKSFVLYFVVIDPLGTLAIFLVVLPNIKGNKSKVALEATAYAFLILIFFFFLGKVILGHLNIGLYSFKIAGGIILLIISLEMMLNKRSERKTKVIKGEKNYSAIYPLAVPLLAGPAAITSVIISSSTTKLSLSSSLYNVTSLFLVLLITFIFFLMAIKYEKFIKTKFLQVLSRIIAILLCALSVQFILDGIREFML